MLENRRNTTETPKVGRNQLDLPEWPLCRTCHPEGAYNIPIRFLSTDIGEKGYKEMDNPDFGKALRDRFNPETDTLIIFCRSGNRSCKGCNEAIKARFKEDKVFNMMGGFEGDKNKDSIYYGKRWAGGWKLEGLPWTYALEKTCCTNRM